MRSLNIADRDEFLWLHKQLILFVNKKFGLYKKFKYIEDLSCLNDEDIKIGIIPIRTKMYNAENIEEFCAQNNELSKEQQSIIKSWSMVYSGNFYIIKHSQNYSVLLDDSRNKLYGVRGISNGFDCYASHDYLPMWISTKLLPFKDYIVYDGFFSMNRIHFGGNISKELKQTYNEIKGMYGIITTPEDHILLCDLEPHKSDGEIIKFHIKESIKNNGFPEQAWKLALKSKENRLTFEYEYAKCFAKYQTSSIKSYKELKSMYYAMYRNCVIGVSDTKKSLIEFCQKHYNDIADYVYIFKS